MVDTAPAELLTGPDATFDLALCTASLNEGCRCSLRGVPPMLLDYFETYLPGLYQAAA